MSIIMYRVVQLIRRFSSHLEEVEAIVNQVVKNFEKVNPREVTRTVTFDELGLDSLDLMELIVEMEQTFTIELSDEETFKIHTVMDAVNMFLKYKQDTTPKIIRP